MKSMPSSSLADGVVVDGADAQDSAEEAGLAALSAADARRSRLQASVVGHVDLDGGDTCFVSAVPLRVPAVPVSLGNSDLVVARIDNSQSAANIVGVECKVEIVRHVRDNGRGETRIVSVVRIAPELNLVDCRR